MSYNNYQALIICQKQKEKPCIEIINSDSNREVVEKSLEKWIKIFEEENTKVLSSWIEKYELKKLDDSKLYKVYIKTNYLNSNEYGYAGSFIDENSAKDIAEHYKKDDRTTDVKIEIIDYKENFYKSICQKYINTMQTQIILDNPDNNSVIHSYIGDEFIELKLDDKINIDNYKDYLLDEESTYEYDTYEDFYEEYVKDYIKVDVRDLGLFNGEQNEWDFYLSYNDMKLLGMEDLIEKAIKEEIAEEYMEEDIEEQEN